jgi:predicted transcriptional regulator
MDYLKILDSLTSPRQGNKPNFEKSHVILLLEILEKEQPIGRISIMRKLGLTEATTKTLIKRLKLENLIEIDKLNGVKLTQKGEELLKYFKSKIKIKEGKLQSIRWKGFFILIKYGSIILEKMNVIEIRDKIVKLGPDKTLIIIIKENNKIEIPPFTAEQELIDLIDELRDNCKDLGCEKDDLVIFISPESSKSLAYKVGLEILKFV